MKPKCVCQDAVKVDPISGLIRIDEVPVMRLVRREGQVRVQILDGNKPRSTGRGSNIIEIPYTEFISCLVTLGDQFEG